MSVCLLIPSPRCGVVEGSERCDSNVRVSGVVVFGSGKLSGGET